MGVEIKTTGERLIENSYHTSLGGYVIYVMHSASYRFVEPLCVGKHVIDLGCGSGYGAARIAKVAEKVEAVDISDEAITFASARYLADNVRFSKITAGKPLPFNDATFDVVLSFQVIEHVKRDLEYLKEAYRVLKPRGVIIVITPDRKHRLLPKQKPWNRWHVREYSNEGLVALMGEVFDIERTLRMGAPYTIAGVEIKRYRWLKWLTLPVTLPFIPEKWRRAGLDVLHALRRPPEVVNALALNDVIPEFGFDDEDMLISESVPNSLNLIVVARKPA